jgi:hypothetical protein
MVLLRNLTRYEINLQNLTLFLAKTLFVIFVQETMEINLGKYHESFYGKESD